MSAALLFTLLTVLAGLLVVVLVPMIWTRVGGAMGMIAGIVAIPLIWAVTMVLGARAGRAIWPEALAASPQTTPAANIMIFSFFALMAVLLSWLLGRGKGRG